MYVVISTVLGESFRRFVTLCKPAPYRNRLTYLLIISMILAFSSALCFRTQQICKYDTVIFSSNCLSLSNVYTANVRKLANTVNTTTLHMERVSTFAHDCTSGVKFPTHYIGSHACRYNTEYRYYRQRTWGQRL